MPRLSVLVFACTNSDDAFKICFWLFCKCQFLQNTKLAIFREYKFSRQCTKNEEILNGKLQFLCSASAKFSAFWDKISFKQAKATQLYSSWTPELEVVACLNRGAFRTSHLRHLFRWIDYSTLFFACIWFASRWFWLISLATCFTNW